MSDKDPDEMITITIYGLSRKTQNHLRGKFTSQMIGLIEAYAKETKIPVEEIAFIFNGRRVNDDDTPQSLKMKEDDVIIMMHPNDTSEIQMIPDILPIGPEDHNDYVEIIVLGHDYNMYFYRIQNDTHMKKLIKQYANRFNIHVENVRFTVDNRRVQDDDTPESLRMSHDDCIQMNDQSQQPYIQIRFLGHDNIVTDYHFKYMSKMIDVMEDYAFDKDIPDETVRFIFNGQIVNNDDTPSSLKIKENDVIQIYLTIFPRINHKIYQARPTNNNQR